MKKNEGILAASVVGSMSWLAATSVLAGSFSIPGGTLSSALETYSAQSGVQVAISSDALAGVQTKGASGEMSPEQALSRILLGTGFTTRRVGNSIAVVRSPVDHSENVTNGLQDIQLAQAAPAKSVVETVTVTSSKLGGADVQSIPISITALSQEQLTATQTAGGPDLIKQVPNMTFTKTNFSGYSIQLRGIGTQAISVTTDPAVAVAFNDQPFIRNHFFEQEFYDVAQVAVLRGPQGTLYGRNATAGVVNLTSAKPTDQFEAMASGELGNYHQRRFEGMINIPIVDDWLDIRIAGEWTKRQGYSFNQVTNERIDNRDLWSGRLTIGWKPMPKLQTYLIWEHFSEDDGRIRSSKQLCKKSVPPTDILGVPVAPGNFNIFGVQSMGANYLSQGCEPTSLYSQDAFQTPYGFSLGYALTTALLSLTNGTDIDPYASAFQSRNLRVIESTIDPRYKAKNDIIELNADYTVAPTLTLISQTAFNHDFLWSTQDYNRFTTSPGFFLITDIHGGTPGAVQDYRSMLSNDGVFCDPQVGCANRLVAQDLSTEHAWQLGQEFRLASSFSGPFNFTAGGNYLHYETMEKYYVFINSLSIWSFYTGQGFNVPQYEPGATDNGSCLSIRAGQRPGYQDPDNTIPNLPSQECIYADPNPIGKVNDQGHNYFLSQNPYTLNSYAAFGEANYNVIDDVKITAGLRWTEDRKHFTLIPSQLLLRGAGYPSSGVVDQEWDQFTGRFNATWSPKFGFTDQTLIFASFAHGYKAGGANPPGAIFQSYPVDDIRLINPIHPLTFEPEFIEAFEVGTKNTLLDGALTLNAGGFYYDYTGYQISEIVDRTAINRNYDAKVKGAEVEGVWEPVPGLRFNFGGGWEDTSIAKGTREVDLMDRTDAANHPDWMVVKPFPTVASNCILPREIVADIIKQVQNSSDVSLGSSSAACGYAYNLHWDPLTRQPFENGTYPFTIFPHDFPAFVYNGFDPSTAPNNGEGFDKDLSGHKLPNAPPFTVSLGAQYSVPLTSDWAGTVRGDYYWQDYSWARVFNDNPYDRIRGYTNVNLTLILTSQSGWQIMLFDKNVFNTTAITGAFLNSDDSALTTNVFLTDPKLIGVRVTKNW